MPKLCPNNSCVGCYACATICHRKAISMTADKRGFIRPTIDVCSCVDCHACENVCPVLKEPSSRVLNSIHPTTAAAWHKNLSIRMSSSSGGAFSALAEYVLNCGGVVYGAGWGNDLKVLHKRIEDISGLEDLRKSKYIQSEIGDTYIKAKKDLQDGRLTLFSGTPCQIAGLYTFLNNRIYDNLYTIDFICHGVPSYRTFRTYVDSLEKKYNDKIDSVNFRNKKLGVECNLIVKIKLHSENIERNLFADDIAYYRGFVDGLFLRESCYECAYNRLPRVADFSLADYRGLGDVEHFHLLADRVYGFTGVMINNNRAHKLFLKSDICYELRSFEELSGHQTILRKPSSKNNNTDQFYEDLAKYDFSYTAKKYMPMSFHRKLDLSLRRMLGPSRYYLFGRFVKKIIRFRLYFKYKP